MTFLSDLLQNRTKLFTIVEDNHIRPAYSETENSPRAQGRRTLKMAPLAPNRWETTKETAESPVQPVRRYSPTKENPPKMPLRGL